MKYFALWTMAFAVLAFPASAQDWREIGSVGLVPKGDIFVQRIRPQGPVARLRIEAEGGDARCLNVQAFYRDGERPVIFHGPVTEGEPVILEFEAGDSSIRQLNFRCSGTQDAYLTVSADAGRFAAEWDSNSVLRRAAGSVSNFTSVWLNDWNYFGGSRFQSRYSENQVAAPDAPVTALALMPMRMDARCRKAEAQLADGTTLPLPLSREDFLAHDQFNRIALPAEARDMASLRLECRATNGSNVMIRLFAAS